jgi:hypothetical protein
MPAGSAFTTGRYGGPGVVAHVRIRSFTELSSRESRVSMWLAANSTELSTQRVVRRPYGYRYSYVMRLLRYSINVIGRVLRSSCGDRGRTHIHRHAVENLAQADALIFGQ